MRGVLLEVEDLIFRLVWKNNAGEYFRKVKGRGSSTIEKRKRQHKRDLEKLTSTIGSIMNMFLTQLNRNRSSDKSFLPTFLLAAPPPTALLPTTPQTTTSAPKSLKRNV